MRPDAPFREPWEAQAFALAVELSDKGIFEWREFSLALGAEIQSAQAQGRDEDYYALWLTALERLLAGKGIVSGVVIDAREAALKSAQALDAHRR
ncbi:MAG: nitrile hydratase accessory protein [Hyphomicrobiales bacterium]|nr:nitrile hydratase accessory protein [Hyphomicrobiales bacterium]